MKTATKLSSLKPVKAKNTVVKHRVGSPKKVTLHILSAKALKNARSSAYEFLIP